MSGHIDSRITVQAPLDLLWQVANSTENDRQHEADGHDVVATDPERGSVTLRIQTPPDADGRSWSYLVERVLDPDRHTVYARRWGNEYFRYSHALWSYSGTGTTSEIRCVQDFEMTPGSPVDDARMEQIIRFGTEKAMRATAQLVESEHRGTAV
jgi:aromatase